MKPLLIFFYLLNTMILGSESIDLKSLLNQISSNDFRSYQVVGKIYSPHDNQTYPFALTFKAEDNHLKVEVKNELCISELELDTKFKFKSSTFNVLADNLIKRTKYNLRLGQSAGNNKAIFNYKKNDDFVKTKTINYNNNTIDTFSIIPVFQAIADKNVSLIKGELAVEHMGIRVPIIIKKETVFSLDYYLSPYTVPNKLLSEMRTSSMPYIIYTIKVTGWQGFIYNHRHFYVFSSTKPHFYIGHWGGPDKLNLFSWADSI
ncbi:MAG: hypothetical protein VXX85_02055 [Candidatus Margulisiibacteriota bacterium]|nr:hypothetical protein [Candidatus Margulisiibacteriota bacterium]